MTDKLTISAKIPQTMHQKMLEQVIQDGYGMRGKSRWISEAIENFLSLNNFPELVEIATEIEEMTDIISCRIPRFLMIKLDEAIVTVRKAFPSLEGVKSSLIRASILQRLIR